MQSETTTIYIIGPDVCVRNTGIYHIDRTCVSVMMLDNWKMLSNRLNNQINFRHEQIIMIGVNTKRSTECRL